MKISWITEGGEELSTSRYRGFNQHRRALYAQHGTVIWIGFTPERWWVTNPPRSMWDEIRGTTCIVQRIPLTNQNRHHFDRVKSLALKVGYDLDDLVWDPTLLPPNCNIPRSECDGYAAGVEWADFVVCSTPFLAAEIQRRWPGKPTHVVRNVLDPLVTGAAESAILAPRQGTQVTLGYSSGTAMHQEDFAIITDALSIVFETHSHVNLCIIGTLPLPPEFVQRWQGRISRWPFVTYDALPALMHSLFDINLVPLQNTRFNTCKSLVKWMEGAVFGVPSICSQVGEFVGLPGNAARSANNTQEWVFHINTLVRDPALRRSIGMSARQHLLSSYTYRQSGDIERLPV